MRTLSTPRIVFIIAALSFVATFYSSHAATVRIIPLGDSITLGLNVPGGYRAPLYQLLTNAGYTVDYLGTQNGNSAPSLPDSNHEGYSGYTIRNIDSILPNFFAADSNPDIILLLLGVNDFRVGDDIDHATNRLEALIVRMTTNWPTAKIIVANLLPLSEPYNTEIQTNFNPFIPGICDRQRAMGHPVYFTDMRSVIQLADLPDQLHPNQFGYNKMATNWFTAINTLLCPSCPATFSVVPVGATWRYLDNATDQGTAWRSTNFNDSTWASGPAQLGFGDGDEATLVNGGASGSRTPTIYFRNTFVVTNRANITNVALRLLRDDGAVVYLNGIEIFRSNMPDVPVTYAMWAALSVGGSEESTFFTTPILPALLLSGTNVLAVEVHQSDPGSSDLSFSLELLANTVLGNQPPVGSVGIIPNSQIVGSNEMFSINLSAYDPETSVSQMDLLQDGVIAGSVSASSATLNWSHAVPGIHEFAARPRDTIGLMSTSTPARVLVTRAGFQGQSVFFPQFSATNGLIIQNNATVSSNLLHLNQGATGSRGGVWLTSQQNVLSGFVSEFRFRIISKVGGGADGFCFNIAGTAQPNIGTSLGYSGITNSIAVEFDTYQNTSASDPDDHHISVHTRGLLANTSDESASLGLYTTPTDFSDGAIHKVKIEYVPGTLRVFLDNLTSPVLSVNVDLSTLLSLPTGNAWIGLAGGTGASFEYHDILAWSFTSYANVPPIVSLTSPAQAIRVAPGANFVVTASASDPNGQITSVRFFDGTTLIGQANTAPYSIVWSNLSSGVHVLSAKADDDGGLETESLPVIVEVLPLNANLILRPDFSSASNLLLQGSAAFVTNRLRLTPAAGGQSGGAWLDSKQFVEYGFETVFQFQITQPSAQGADGIVFVIQSNPSPLLGGGGYILGYGSIPYSIAIEFDTYQNSEAADPDANHISVHSQGASPNSAHESASLGRTSPSVNMSDGKIHTVVIRYAAGMLRVFLDDMLTPALKIPIDVGTLLALDNDSVWAGFTSSTGAEFENHDILMWSFRPNRPPSVQLAPITGLLVAPTNVVLSADAFDTDGEITKVEFFVDGSSIGAVETAPFLKSWATSSAGNFHVTAKATDDLGETATSSAVVLSVFEFPHARVVQANDGFEFEFATTTGQTYTMQYSADLVNWSNAVPSFTGTGALQHWRDTGPPVTDSSPTNQPRRFYRIVVSP